MMIELEAEQAFEIWEIFSTSINPKEKEIVASQFVEWLADSGMPEHELADLVKMDRLLADAVKDLIGDDDLDDELNNDED